MNLGIGSQQFIVTGASTGLGRAVAERLAGEGAYVLAVARRKELLNDLSKMYPGLVTILAGDVKDEAVQEQLSGYASEKGVHGIFVNAGGPPAKTIAETTTHDWDEAYRLLIRWKVELVGRMIPIMERNQYGRILFSESTTVRQPMKNLVLSNSLRMAVAGYSKTLSMEYATAGITSNLIAPGYHETDAVERLFKKTSEQEEIPYDEAKSQMIDTIPMKSLGRPEAFATLACWLLSPLSGFVTGQVYSLDGGNIRSTT